MSENEASAHVTIQDPTATATELPVNIKVGNIKYGFANGDILTGSIPRTTDGGTNTCTISSINGSDSTTTVPSMKKDTSDLVTDDTDRFTGVFYIPNNDNLRFRTGERILRLIDNINNNPETGLHSSKSLKRFILQLVLQKKENKQFLM